MPDTPLLDIADLSIAFPTAGGIRAVDGISLALHKGRTLALVGESGSGKSATSLALLRLLPPTATTTGQILFQDTDLLTLPESRMRRLRGQHFMPELFADPAWDILLDLTAARLEGRMVAVSSLCIAAAVPATTALRWITQMTEQTILVRKPDPSDGRRVFIGLSEQAIAGMDAYLASAKSVVVPVG